MDRREFVKTSTMGMGTLAAGLSSKDLAASPAPAPAAATVASNQVGRPVRVVSIGFTQGHSLETVTALVDKEGAAGTDLIALPETFMGQNAKSTETLDGRIVTEISRLAKKHSTYVVCPIDRFEGKRRYNTSILIDRKGQIVGMYNKLYPVFQMECVKDAPQQGVHPGEGISVYDTDFGKVGLAICFDVNWSPLWQRMANQGAELVIWSSAYSAGRSLQAQAIANNYYIVSSTWVPDCLVFDIDGERLSYDKENQGRGVNITRTTLDLDRCIFHQDINYPDLVGKLIKERGDDVEQEKWMAMEGWLVLKAKRPGVSARELARQYGMEELTHYINRSRCEIDRCRGWEFHG